ncbi:MAG: hypothetical protein V3V61_02240, partial [Gammaproteobacteria bacterium]
FAFQKQFLCMISLLVYLLILTNFRWQFSMNYFETLPNHSVPQAFFTHQQHQQTAFPSPPQQPQQVLTQQLGHNQQAFFWQQQPPIQPQPQKYNPHGYTPYYQLQ